MLPKSRKRVTASARARTSVSKMRKVVNKGSDGSYLQDKETVSNLPAVTQPSTSSSNSDAIMSMLYEIKDSNAELARRLDKVERQNSTPLNPRPHSIGQGASPQLGFPRMPYHIDGAQGRDHIAISDLGQFNPQPHPPTAQQFTQGHATRGNQGHSHDTDQLPRPQAQTTYPMDRRDAVVPNLQTLRNNPTLSEAVNNLLASYEGRMHSELSQGKPQTKKSGRYNLHDTVSSAPHLRWPNEGFHATNGKKRVAYDDLSLPQWISGQLSNIHAIADPTVSKQALLQVIHAMRDAVSLPWPAVRAAWASSMHQVEEGYLSWADATQWAINRLSASQVALAHTQAPTQPSPHRRPCKFYNESSCSHETHHGSYAHICSNCIKQGKNLNHPESRCNNKQRQAPRQQQAAT